MTAHPPAERGVALVMVLWLVVGLALVVLAGAHSARLYTQRVGLELNRLRVEAVLDAAVQRAAGAMLADRQLASAYRRWRLPIGSDPVELEVVPASGLVDPNVASPELLQALFQRVGGLPPGEAQVLAARVHDYIDPDDVPSGVGGAERAQYEAAGAVGRPRNAGLDDPGELRFVLGMPPELYDIIFPFLGMNGQQRLNVGAAPPALIDALSGQPGLGASVRVMSPESRSGLLQSGLLSTMFTASSAGTDQTVRVRAWTQDSDQRWWERQVWLDLIGRPGSLTPWTTRSMEPVRRAGPPGSLP